MSNMPPLSMRFCDPMDDEIAELKNRKNNIKSESKKSRYK